MKRWGSALSIGLGRGTRRLPVGVSPFQLVLITLSYPPVLFWISFPNSFAAFRSRPRNGVGAIQLSVVALGDADPFGEAPVPFVSSSTLSTPSTKLDQAFRTPLLSPEAALPEMGFGVFQLLLVALGDADLLEGASFISFSSTVPAPSMILGHAASTSSLC